MSEVAVTVRDLPHPGDIALAFCWPDVDWQPPTGWTVLSRNTFYKLITDPEEQWTFTAPEGAEQPTEVRIYYVTEGRAS
jgi:hypothetical protein